MNIIQSPSPNHSARANGARIAYIIVHATGGTDSLQWLRSPRSKVSAHYLISRDGTLYQLVQDDRSAWHAGISKLPNGRTDTNSWSIGIELENLNNGVQEYTTAQMNILAELIYQKMQKYNIPRSNVVSHAQVAPKRKKDPLGFNWAHFWTLIDKLENVTTVKQVYIVTCDALNIREGPGLNFSVERVIYKDDIFVSDGVTSEWVHICSGSSKGAALDNLGYVHKSCLRLLAEV